MFFELEDTQDQQRVTRQTWQSKKIKQTLNRNPPQLANLSKPKPTSPQKLCFPNLTKNHLKTQTSTPSHQKTFRSYFLTQKPLQHIAICHHASQKSLKKSPHTVHSKNFPKIRSPQQPTQANHTTQRPLRY